MAVSAQPCECESSECPVALMLHDKSRHQACKTKLIHVSEYFEAMFRTDFKEKQTNEVNLQEDISKSDLLVFLDAKQHKLKLLPSDAASLRSLIFLGDRFMCPSMGAAILPNLPVQCITRTEIRVAGDSGQTQRQLNTNPGSLRPTLWQPGIGSVGQSAWKAMSETGGKTKYKLCSAVRAVSDAQHLHRVVGSKLKLSDKKALTPKKKRKQQTGAFFLRGVRVDGDKNSSSSDTENDDQPEVSNLSEVIVDKLRNYDPQWFATAARDNPQYFIDVAQYEKFARKEKKQ